MATRSHIGFYDGHKMHFIYCHNDGYLSHTGVILYLYYKTPQRVKKLISLGDISAIGYNIDAPSHKGAETVSYCNSYACSHIKTSYVLSYCRDLKWQWKDAMPTTCSLSKYPYKDSEGISYSYYYDVTKKEWFLIYGCGDGKGVMLYSLRKLFTDKKFYDDYREWSGNSESFETITESINRFMEMYNINPVNFFNEHIRHRNIRDMELGYSMENGKRLYAVMQKVQGKLRRKVLFRSDNIGVCLEKIFNTAGISFY